MRAIVRTKYGPPDVLQFQQVEKPIPKDDELLIRIYATTAIVGEWELRGLRFPIYFRLPMRIMFGLSGPRNKTLGFALAGEIESVGKDVKLFRKGDQVFGSTGFGMGAHAEYKCLPETGTLAIKPAKVTYEEAVTIPFGGNSALVFLREEIFRAGKRFLSMALLER